MRSEGEHYISGFVARRIDFGLNRHLAQSPGHTCHNLSVEGVSSSLGWWRLLAVRDVFLQDLFPPNFLIHNFPWAVLFPLRLSHTMMMCFSFRNQLAFIRQLVIILIMIGVQFPTFSLGRLRVRVRVSLLPQNLCGACLTCAEQGTRTMCRHLRGGWCVCFVQRVSLMLHV